MSCRSKHACLVPEAITLGPPQTAAPAQTITANTIPACTGRVCLHWAFRARVYVIGAAHVALSGDGWRTAASAALRACRTDVTFVTNYRRPREALESARLARAPLPPVWQCPPFLASVTDLLTSRWGEVAGAVGAKDRHTRPRPYLFPSRAG